MAGLFRPMLGAVAVTLLIAGCGADQTAAAAKCLRNALAAQALGDNGSNCADTTALKATGGNMPAVTCTHQNGNQYICHTAARAFDPFHVANHFYSVTYDGKSIVYQQTQ